MMVEVQHKGEELVLVLVLILVQSTTICPPSRRFVRSFVCSFIRHGCKRRHSFPNIWKCTKPSLLMVPVDQSVSPAARLLERSRTGLD